MGNNLVCTSLRNTQKSESSKFISVENNTTHCDIMLLIVPDVNFLQTDLEVDKY
jgi:hypothetical protein